MTNTMKFYKELERYGLVKDSQFMLNIPLELLREIVDKFSELPEQESKGSDGHELDDDIPPTSQYFPTSSQTQHNSPKVEATELVDKMYQSATWRKEEDYNPLQQYQRIKKCALIAVDEILNMVNYQVMYIDLKSLDVIYSYEYWEQVKQEIEKL